MKITLPILLISLLALSCGSSKIIQSEWNDEQYEKSKVGKLKFDSQSGFMYGISNDDENLYVSLRISDRVVQRKIFSMGMTVWIDTTGKKQEKLGITFPVGMRSAMANARGEQQGERSQVRRQPQQEQIPGRQDYRNRMAAATQQIKLTGFDIEEIKNTNEIIPGVLSGKIERDAMNMMQYTLVVPFEKVPGLKGKNGFTIGIKTGVVNMGDMAAMRERMMAHGGGGRPGGGGGAVPGGRRPGGGFSAEDMESMAVPTELWLKNIQLANKK